MKRIIGLAVGCVLGGCETAPNNRQQSMLMVQNPMVQEKIFRQDTAPLPWVHVLPSERAAHFLDADFDYLARRIRHAMTINPAKFADVRLVLVDYAILEPKLLTTKPMKKKYKGQKYCQEYISKPERYFMRLSFYRQNQQPPAPPLFVGAAVLSVRHAAPFEAMHFLVDDIIDERLKLPYSQVEVNLDAAEDIEKNLQELADSTTKTHKVSSKSETSVTSHKARSSTKEASTKTAKTASSSSSEASTPTPPPSEAVPSSTTAAPASGPSTTTPTAPPPTTTPTAPPSSSSDASTTIPPTSEAVPSSTTAAPAPGTSTTIPMTPSPITTPPSSPSGASTMTPPTPSSTQGTSTAIPTAPPETSSPAATSSSSQGTPTATSTTSSTTTPST